MRESIGIYNGSHTSINIAYRAFESDHKLDNNITELNLNEEMCLTKIYSPIMYLEFYPIGVFNLECHSLKIKQYMCFCIGQTLTMIPSIRCSQCALEWQKINGIVFQDFKF